MSRFNLIYQQFVLLALSLSLLLGTTTCTTKEKDPAPTTGSIEGVISPAGTVTTVTAQTASGLTFPTTPNATSGAFALPDLAPGAYTLSFTPATGYQAPADRSITVEAGRTANAGTVSVISDGSFRSGTVTWSVGGTTYTATTVSGYVDSFNRTMFLDARAVTSTSTERLRLLIGTVFGGANLYPLGNSAYVSTEYDRLTNGIPTASYGSLGASTSATGGIEVVTYSATGGTMSGTFGYTAQGKNGTSGSISVINGTFSLRF